MDELKLQYRMFLERLGGMTSKLSTEELSKTDSKELIMRFFDPAGKEYENIEMIMQVNIDNIPHSKINHNFIRQ